MQFFQLSSVSKGFCFFLFFIGINHFSQEIISSIIIFREEIKLLREKVLIFVQLVWLTAYNIWKCLWEINLSYNIQFVKAWSNFSHLCWMLSIICKVLWYMTNFQPNMINHSSPKFNIFSYHSLEVGVLLDFWC